MIDLSFIYEKFFLLPIPHICPQYFLLKVVCSFIFYRILMVCLYSSGYSRFMSVSLSSLALWKSHKKSVK